ncbi:MAG: hypothetical protein ACE5IB_03760 [Candidatus Geothermarchaeales archaeon]
MSEVGETETAILKALQELDKPSGCGDIGKQAGINWRIVMGKLRGLKKDGLVESPIKGKYVVTERGKGLIE